MVLHVVKDGVGERNGFPFMDQRAEDLEKGLETGPYYNVIRGSRSHFCVPGYSLREPPGNRFRLGSP